MKYFKNFTMLLNNFKLIFQQNFLKSLSHSVSLGCVYGFLRLMLFAGRSGE